jgi:hypothetical protein
MSFLIGILFLPTGVNVREVKIMPNHPTPNTSEGILIPCEVCEKEIPVSEAIISEAEDYVLFFCGAECFDRWRKKAEKLFPKEKY